MAEYIDREAFIETVKDIPMWGSVAVMFADSIPTADVAPVIRGRWEKQSGLYSCSECGTTCPYDVQADVIEYWACNYCPNCGAKMDGGAENASKEM